MMADDEKITFCGHGSDEAARIVRWVDAHGGIEEVERRLMPEGVEWLRYEDGEPVRIGDRIMLSDGSTEELYQVRMSRYGLSLYTETCEAKYRYGERIKRPPTLAADGEPLKVGQTVWHSKTGREYVVVDPLYCNTAVVRLVADDDVDCEQYSPNELTHQRPVLAADGDPVRVGDEVYSLTGGGPYTVTEIDPGHMHVSITFDTHNGELNRVFNAAFLTHAKPEPTDTLSQECRDNDACDRDALLALADEFEREADVAAKECWRTGDDGYAGESCAYRDCARRIREACGVGA